MKKIMAILSSLLALYMMSLPVMADIAADPVPVKEGTKFLPFFLVIGVVVIAAVILFLALRRKK